MVRNIDANEVERLKEKDNVVLVNVLSEESFRSKHIPGSINIPNESVDFEEQMRRQVPSKQSRVIVHCSDPDCQASPTAAKRLEEIGYEDVMDFEAGLQGWREAGNEFEGEKQQVQAET